MLQIVVDVAPSISEVSKPAKDIFVDAIYKVGGKRLGKYLCVQRDAFEQLPCDVLSTFSGRYSHRVS